MSETHVADRLQRSLDRSHSMACVGLDPRPELVPPPIRAAALAMGSAGRAAVAWAFRAYCLGILQAVAGRCAAVKPQVACFEAYGWEGQRALEEVLAAAHQLAIPVIVDGKRGDIGSTVVHYRQAWLGGAPGLDQDLLLPGAGADWLTVNGYLGADGVSPFLGQQVGDGGVFVLVRTSNPTAADLQDVACVGGGTVMEVMANLVAAWGRNRLGRCGLSDVGAVVGATCPDQARRLRALMPDTWFLVPGYGAQGAGAADALAGRRPDGRGVLVNSSRGIIGAWQKQPARDWQEVVRAALEDMNRDLGAVL